MESRPSIRRLSSKSRKSKPTRKISRNSFDTRLDTLISDKRDLGVDYEQPKTKPMKSKTLEHKIKFYEEYDEDPYIQFQEDIYQQKEANSKINRYGNDVNDLFKLFEQEADLNIEKLGEIGRIMLSLSISRTSKKPNYESKIEELKKKEKIFIDPDFPSNLSSIGDKDEIELKCNAITWKRLPDLFQENHDLFLSQNLDPLDIDTGIQGITPFISAISALMEAENAAKKLFISREKNNLGIFGLNFFIFGEWKEILIDSQIPTGKNNKPLFCKLKKNESWLILIEKAMAKYLYTYSALSSGSCSKYLNILSGAPCFTIYTEDSAESLFTTLLEYTKQKIIMSASSYNWSKEELEEKSENNYMNLLGSYDVKAVGANVKLIRLRNPWGVHEWKGNWNTKDSRWVSVPEKEKQRIGFCEKSGITFMEFNDFIHYFDAIHVCFYQEGFVDSSYTPLTLLGNRKMFKIEIKEDGIYFFSIYQVSSNGIENVKAKANKNTTFTLALSKLNRNYEPRTTILASDVVTLGNKLSEPLLMSTYSSSTYVLDVKSESKNLEPPNYVVSVYGKAKVNIFEFLKEENN